MNERHLVDSSDDAITMRQIPMSKKSAAPSMGLLILVLLPGQPLDFPNDLNRWYVTSPPEEGSDEWFAANADTSHQWMVIAGKNRPKVSLRGQGLEVPPTLPFKIPPGSAREGLAGKRIVARAEDGWIVGFNAGEFGAGLWWFSRDGKRRQKISHDNVIDLIPTASGLLAIEGLAHGGISRGKIVRLSRKKDGGWVTDPFLDLGHGPQVATTDADGSLVIATTNRLLRVAPASKKLDVLLDKVFWGGLYPNSIVIVPSGTIYLGMRHGIAKVEKAGANYKVHWLLPPMEAGERTFRAREKEPGKSLPCWFWDGDLSAYLHRPRGARGDRRHLTRQPVHQGPPLSLRSSLATLAHQRSDLTLPHQALG